MSKKVASVYKKFLTEHGMKCDRSVDDCWNDFDDYINQPKKETIITRNIKAVKQIIEAGYGYMLKRTEQVLISITRDVLSFTRILLLKILKQRLMLRVRKNIITII